MAIINDGTGKSFKNKIDMRNNLWVQSRTVPSLELIAIEGNYYELTTSRLTLTATGGNVLYFKFTETNKLLAWDSMRFYWNGGNTNYNRCCKIDLKLVTSITTLGGHTATTPYNTRTGSPKQCSMTAYRWDNSTGDGMTGFVTPVTISQRIVSPGFTEMRDYGTHILPPNAELMFSAAGYEAGDLCIDIQFHLLDPSIDEYAVL